MNRETEILRSSYEVGKAKKIRLQQVTGELAAQKNGGELEKRN